MRCSLSCGKGSRPSRAKRRAGPQAGDAAHARPPGCPTNRDGLRDRGLGERVRARGQRSFEARFLPQRVPTRVEPEHFPREGAFVLRRQQTLEKIDRLVVTSHQHGVRDMP